MDFSIGQVLGEAVDIYGRRVAAILGITLAYALWQGVVVVALMMLVASTLGLPMDQLAAPGRRSVALPVGFDPAGFFGTFLLAASLLGLAHLLWNGTLIDLAARASRGQPLDLAANCRTSWRRLWASASAFLLLFLAVGVLLFVFVVIGTQLARLTPLFLVVEGIVLLVGWVFLAVQLAFVQQAAVLDDAGGWGAVTGSVEAVEGAWWRTFAILLVIFVIYFIANTVVGLVVPAGSLPSEAGGIAPYLARTTLHALLGALCLSFASVATTLLYLKLTTPAAAPVRVPVG